MRLPEYAYVVRISEANLCDIGTSCNTAYNNFGRTVFPDTAMFGFRLKHLCRVLPLPQPVKKLQQKGKKKIKREKPLI